MFRGVTLSDQGVRNRVFSDRGYPMRKTAIPAGVASIWTGTAEARNFFQGIREPRTSTMTCAGSIQMNIAGVLTFVEAAYSKTTINNQPICRNSRRTARCGGSRSGGV